ncbi:MAG: filamentous hemagglutinin N-terminal domain-containing protein, partial [Actinomycetota bacterium]
MNKHLYRIVFNQARGLLMAVAETAASHSDGRQAASSPEGAGPRRWASLRPLSLALWTAFGLVALPATGQIVADRGAPSNQQPTVLNAANGVPQVNIQTPSGAGVSRNTYSQFDVNANGAILNNSRTNTQTQLGGWVQGNPWLAGGTARVILNEVNSSNPSLLRGYVEVAGDRAQVVIANPAGISCDGCGFINANRITLTTGTPVMNGGALDSYRVQRGVVSVGGAGLDARTTDFTDIIARAVQVNAGIWANTLKVTAGANEVSADHAQTTPTAGTGTAPAYAIDVAALGGMYAGKITLVGTENGLGVRNAGNIGASAGEVVVTADGKLINSGTISTGAQALKVASRGLDNAGTLSSQADLSIRSQGDVTNSGLINAGREAKLDVTGKIDNRGTLGGQRLDIAADGLDNAGTLRQTGSQGLAISGQAVGNQSGGTLGRLVQDTTTPTGTGTTSPSATPTPTGTGTPPSTATGGGTVTEQPVAPVVLADGSVAIRGQIANSGTLTGNGRIDLAATSLDNRGTLNADTLAVTGERFANAGGKLNVTDLSVRVTTFDNRAGKLEVGNRLAIDTRDLTNAGGELRHAGTGDLAIRLPGRLDNTGGTIASNGANLTLSAATLDNTDGHLEHAGTG